MSIAPDFGRLGYLAVSADELVLIKMESGTVKTHLGEVLARVPRSQIVSAEFKSSAMYASAVTITFANGDTWLLKHHGPTVRMRPTASELGWAKALAERGESQSARQHAARALDLSREHGYGAFEPGATAMLTTHASIDT